MAYNRENLKLMISYHKLLEQYRNNTKIKLKKELSEHCQAILPDLKKHAYAQTKSFENNFYRAKIVYEIIKNLAYLSNIRIIPVHKTHWSDNILNLGLCVGVAALLNTIFCKKNKAERPIWSDLKGGVYIFLFLRGIEKIVDLKKDKNNKLEIINKRMIELFHIIKKHSNLFTVKKDGSIIIFEEGERAIYLKGQEFIIKKMFSDEQSLIWLVAHYAKVFRDSGIDLIEHRTTETVRNKISMSTPRQVYYFDPSEKSVLNQFYNDSILSKLLKSNKCHNNLEEEITVLKIILNALRSHYGRFHPIKNQFTQLTGYRYMSHWKQLQNGDLFIEKLDDVFNTKRGLCHEYNLIMAFFIEKAKKEGFLKGKFFIEIRLHADGQLAHSFMTYKFTKSQPELFIIDPLHNCLNFYSKLKKSKQSFYKEFPYSYKEFHSYMTCWDDEMSPSTTLRFSNTNKTSVSIQKISDADKRNVYYQMRSVK